MFQSPRSGQICSNTGEGKAKLNNFAKGFNPLDRVKFVQIMFIFLPTILWLITFQSPRSGQICSNARQRAGLG